MKLMPSFLRRPAAMASLLLAIAVPTAGSAADPSAPRTRPIAPVGTPIQQVNFNSCPNGDCYSGGGGGVWGNRWGGDCATCNAGGLFGRGCRHGLASGQAWVRPPATWGLSRTPNMYRYYWNAQLAGGPVATGVQYPMVYQPTDTSQLGFYYQSVPRWYYRPDMLPPAPAPYWPLGMNRAYGFVYPAGVAGEVVAPAPGGLVPVPAQQPAPAVAPPPPAEPQINVPEPEATFFPNRARR